MFLIDRRSLLAGLFAAPSFLRAQKNTQNRLRVAFIGVGSRGGFLAATMPGFSDVEIVATCDLDEMKEIAAVIVATLVDRHIAQVIAVLESGKSVYSEKPMALTPDECNTILQATINVKGIHQAGFQLRHEPNRAAAIKFIHSGGMGRVLYCQGYRHTGDLPRNTLWLFDRARSGDNIVEQACHTIDLFMRAIGKPRVRAMGSGGVSLDKDIPPAAPRPTTTPSSMSRASRGSRNASTVRKAPLISPRPSGPDSSSAARLPSRCPMPAKVPISSVCRPSPTTPAAAKLR